MCFTIGKWTYPRFMVILTSLFLFISFYLFVFNYNRRFGDLFVAPLILSIYCFYQGFDRSFFKYLHGREQFVILDVEYDGNENIIKIGNKENMFSIAELRSGFNKKYYFYYVSICGIKEPRDYYLSDDFLKKACIQTFKMGCVENFFYSASFMGSFIKLTIEPIKDGFILLGSDGTKYFQDDFLIKKLHKLTNHKYILHITNEEFYEDYRDEISELTAYGMLEYKIY